MAKKSSADCLFDGGNIMEMKYLTSEQESYYRNMANGDTMLIRLNNLKQAISTVSNQIVTRPEAYKNDRVYPEIAKLAKRAFSSIVKEINLYIDENKNIDAMPVDKEKLDHFINQYMEVIRLSCLIGIKMWTRN